MKTLKFMLAAATAIGLASASQAVGPYRGSTSFEGDTLNSTITTSTADSFWTVPSSAEDGDYTIVAGTPDSNLRSNGAVSKFGSTNAQVLQLEGGTDPLLRSIDTSGSPVDLTAGEVYVDTLVQFTVTPAGDTVTAGSGDKLMIYLKENTNEVAGAVQYSTNLVVLAAQYTAGDGWTTDDTFTPVHANVTGVSVNAGEWYRLQVKSYAENGIALFTISINGTDLVSQTALYTDEAQKIFPALTGKASTSLTAVGFAGSGKVDDLLFTTFEPDLTVLDFQLVLAGAMVGIDGDVTYSNAVDRGSLSFGTNTVYCYGSDPSVTVEYKLLDGYSASWDTNPNGATITQGAVYTLTVTQNPTGVDFTLTLAAGVSSVTWTIDGSNETVNATTAYHNFPEGTLTLTSVGYQPWYVAGALKQGDTVTISGATAATVDALELGNSSSPLPSGTQPSAVGISNPAIESGDLNSVLQWAKTAYGSSAANMTTALAAINGMDFTPGSENTAAKAYLFNCTEAQVAAEEANFKFPSITPGEVPSVNGPLNAETRNGTVTYYGGNAVNAINVTPPTSSHKFFKATLTK